MPELPEIFIIARQMNHALAGKTVRSLRIVQPKCLNRPEEEYHHMMPGRTVLSVTPLGKWIALGMDHEMRLMINLGMGGEICRMKDGSPAPGKYQLIVTLSGGIGFYVSLWWFGYFHLILSGETHAMTDFLGPDPLTLSVQAFKDLLDGRRGQIKPFLLNQKHIRGIGNFYIQEILFRARLHPRRTIPSLQNSEIVMLLEAIQGVMKKSIRLGSSAYELDFYGQKGRYNLECMGFAYRESGICPLCGAVTEKIATGSTSQYICPSCQKP